MCMYIRNVGIFYTKALKFKMVNSVFSVLLIEERYKLVFVK